MDLEFPFKPMKKRNIAKVWFFLVAMLGLDFNWLNKTFELWMESALDYIRGF